VTRSKVTGNLLANALHAFHRFNRRYRVKIVVWTERMIYFYYLFFHLRPIQ
jgi:hypothetical protein